MSALIATQPASAQRVIVNPSFESNDPLGAGAPNFQIFTNGQVPGWDSTSGDIELWDTNFSGVPAYQGAVFAEMNANVAGALFQNICLINGESIGWSFAHRARSGGLATQTAYFQVTNSSGTLIQNLATQASTVASNVWNVNAGSTTYTGASGLQRVQFVTTDPGSYGNFLDDIRITLNPYAELSSAATSGIESNANANLPKLLINGTLYSAISVQVTVTGGTAVLGSDYTTPNGTANFTVTIPAGTYSNSQIDTGIQIINDSVIESSETINLSLNTGSGYTVASNASCGGVPVTASTYTITDNDAQVTLTKNWTNGLAGNATSLSIAGATSATAGSSIVGGATTVASATAATGAALTFTEAYTVGSSTNYATSFECRRNSDNALITTGGSGLVFTTTMPAATAINCTFFNSRIAQRLQLAKNWTAGITGHTVSVITSGGTANASMTATAPTPATGSFVTVYAGDNISLPVETYGGGATASMYTASVTCTGGSPLSAGAPARALTITTSVTDTICTYGNVYNTPLTVVKSSLVLSDPTNGGTNPKAIPGAVMRYCILVTNGGTLTATGFNMSDTIPGNTAYVTNSMASGGSCATAATAEDDNAIGADETDPVGMSIAGQTIAASTASLAASASVALTFQVTVN